MRATPRSTLLSRPSLGRTAAAPLATVLLALALLSQAGMAMAHTLSHGVRGPSARAAVDGMTLGRSEEQQGEHRPGPADPDKSCDVCAAIAVGKLGWATPPGPAAAVAGPALPVEIRIPALRVLEVMLTSAAPRGPPARA